MAVPKGIGPVLPPPYGPELRPAEHLWTPAQEAVIDRHFAGLDGSMPPSLRAIAASVPRPMAVTPHTIW